MKTEAEVLQEVYESLRQGLSESSAHWISERLTTAKNEVKELNEAIDSMDRDHALALHILRSNLDDKNREFSSLNSTRYFKVADVTKWLQHMIEEAHKNSAEPAQDDVEPVPAAPSPKVVLIQFFKPSGKWYTSETLELPEGVDGYRAAKETFPAHHAKRIPSMYMLVTNSEPEGQEQEPYIVPHLYKPLTQTRGTDDE